MADEGISSKVSLLGDKEYKTALADIGRQLTMLNTDMKATQTAFGDQEKSVEALQSKSEGLQKVYDAHAEKVRLVSEQLNKAKDEYGENSKQADNLQIALNKARTAMNEVGNTLQATNKELEEAKTAQQAAAEGGEDLAKSSDKAEKELKDEGDAAQKAEKDTGGFKDALASAAASAAQFTLDAVSAAFAAVTAAAAAAGKAVVDSLQVYASFDDGMKQVQATMGLVSGSSAEADANIAKLTTAAQEAGASTAFTARDAADALNYLALAGYDTDEAIAALPGVLTLAAAGGMDLAKASDMVTDAMSALHLTDMDAFMDSMAVTSQKSNTNVEMLGEAILKLGSTGTMVKGGVDEINLVLGLLADNGIKGSEAGTHLRNMILSLTNPQTDAACAMIETLGLKVYDATGSMRAMPDIIADLNGSLDGMTDEQRIHAISAIFNKTDIASVNALLGTSGERWEELADEIANSEGAAQQMADTMESGLGGSLRSFNSATEGLQIAVGTIFSDMAQGMVDSTTGMIRDITGILSDGIQPGDIQQIADVLAAFLDEQLTNIIGLVGDALPLVGEAIGTVVGVLVEQLPGLVDKLLPAAMDLLQTVVDAVADNAEPLASLAVEILTNIVSFLLENAATLLQAAIGIVTGLVDGIIEQLPELIPLAVTMIVELATALVAALPELIARLPEIVEAILAGLHDIDWLQLGMDMINGLVGGLNNAVTSLLTAIGDVFNTILKAILGVFGIKSPSTEMEAAGGFLLDGLVAGLSAAVDGVINVVRGIFGRIWDAIKSIFGIGKSESEESKEAKEAGKDIMTGMQKGIEDNEDNLKDVVRGVSRTVLGTFQTELGIEGGTSSKTRPFGEAAAVGVNDGLRNKGQPATFSGGASAAANAMASALNSAFGVGGTGFLGLGAAQASKFLYIGDAVAAGIAQGITGGAGKISDAARAAANAAYEAAKRELGIASPSRRMREVGLQFDEGFGEGIREGMENVVRGARTLAAMAADETARGGGGDGGQAIDYARLGDEVADAFIRKGIDRTELIVDGEALGSTLEPGVSRATYRRSGQTATGRAARMVLV